MYITSLTQLKLHCKYVSGSASSAYSIVYYGSTDCSGEPIVTANGAGACDCTSSSYGGYTISGYANCAGETTGCSSSSSNSSGKSNSSTGAAVGGALGGLAAIAALAGLIYYFKFVKKSSPLAEHAEQNKDTEMGGKI